MVGRTPTLSEILAVPDILGSFRHGLTFGPVPGMAVNTASAGSQGLYLKNVDLIFPPIIVGHVRVPLLNFSRGFAGHRDFQNRFQAAFYEDSKGGTYQTLWAWKNRASGSRDNNRRPQAEYAVNAVAEIFDTAGRVALSVSLVNCWPVLTTLMAATENESGPAIIHAEFSCDFINLTEDDAAVLAANTRGS